MCFEEQACNMCVHLIIPTVFVITILVLLELKLLGKVSRTVLTSASSSEL